MLFATYHSVIVTQNAKQTHHNYKQNNAASGVTIVYGDFVQH